MTIVYKNSPVYEVIRHYGGEAKTLAKVLDVTPGAVSHWLEAGYVPASRAIQIERKTKGKFRAIDLVK